MYTAVFESLDATRPGWSAAFAEPEEVLSADTPDDVRRLLHRAETASREGKWVVLAMAYEAAPAFDPAFLVHARSSFPLAWMAVFGGRLPPPPLDAEAGSGSRIEWCPEIGVERYRQQIRCIHDHISAGDTYQVNYTFPMRGTLRGDAWQYYRRLASAQRAPYCAYLDIGGSRILSASPELFFMRRGNRLVTRPMKGTMPRGRWTDEDDRRARELRDCPKNRAENVMIVDLLRNDLGRIAVPGSVRVSRLFEVERYPTVLQMTSTIEAECGPRTGLVDLMGALFPCGSITGAPKIETMKIIHACEPFPRGIYTGTLGFIEPGGDCTFNVAIRTVQLDAGTGEAVCGVGGGITADSTADGEYEECVLKARFLGRTHPSFELLESLLLEDGEYLLLDRHIHRVEGSARYFGFALDIERLRQTLDDLRTSHDTGAWKVRVVIDRTGGLSTDVRSITPGAWAVRTVAMADAPIDPSDVFLYHKTTNRGVYSRALSAAPEGVDDVILWNDRGEVTESCMANVVVQCGDRKFTPPVESGLLAGTFRQELLETGQVEERVVKVDELASADVVYLVNSVRRWMRAETPSSSLTGNGPSVPTAAGRGVREHDNEMPPRLDQTVKKTDHSCIRRCVLAYLLMFLSLPVLARNHAGRTDGELRIYIAVDDHTDYLWSADDDEYRHAFLEMLDHYIARAAETVGDPPEFQSRFCCDGSLWMWEYEKHRSPEQFGALIDRIKSGHITVPLTPLVMLVGAMPTEAVLRSMYYAGKIERRHGLRFPLAQTVENQVLPYGVGSLYAGAGAKYAWHGICACATRVPGGAQDRRQHEVYWWTGRDGRRVLMKWYSLWQGNASLGGYAEARDPAQAIDFAAASAEFARVHPYRVVGIFGKGWDDLMTLTDEFPRVARAKTRTNRKVIVSNAIDFFEDMERSHGTELPAFSAAFGNEWDILTASMSETSAGVRRAVEKLRAAEAMAAIVSARDATFMDGREEARDLAWLNLGLYYEHDWCANGGVPRKRRAEWQRDTAQSITSYVDKLHDDALAELARMIPRGKRSPRAFVFNPLGWRRTAVADLPAPFVRDVHVVDLAADRVVPSQVVRLDGRQMLRILARDLPSVGYKVYEIRRGEEAPDVEHIRAEGDVLDNGLLRVRVGMNGAITSLEDLRYGGRQLVRRIGGRFMNDMGAAKGSVEVEDSGPVCATVKVTAAGPVAHTTHVTLVRGQPRVFIRNEITENFGEVRDWAFGFEISDPDVWHEEAGAVIRARLLADGGHYSPKNARYDWLTLNHFVDISGQGHGVTLSSADCSFFALGNSRPAQLDVRTPQVRVLAGGQVDGPGLGIPNQDGSRHFVHRFALCPHDGFGEADAMRFALEHQNPPVVGLVVGGGGALPEAQFSFLRVEGDDVLLWALKPSDDGPDGRLVVRLWNMGGEPASVAVRITQCREACHATHIETPLDPVALRDATARVRISPRRLDTLLLTRRRE